MRSSMEIIKLFIRLPFNLFGLTLHRTKSLGHLKRRINEILNLSSSYYNYYLFNKEILTGPEILQYLEMKYGGYVTNVPPTIDKTQVKKLFSGYHTGGDRMNVFFHNYSEKYFEYLKEFQISNKILNVVEIGILNGTGLAIWDGFFQNKKLYGLDYDLGNIQGNLGYLISKGAFKDGLPVLSYYDQFTDNSNTLSMLFHNDCLDIVIDDAFHSELAILNTFRELEPYLNEHFVYFIEDNTTIRKKLEKKYPEFNYDSSGHLGELTIVTRK